MVIRLFSLFFMLTSLLVVCRCPATAGTVAVLPFADLSTTSSGVDLELTRQLSATLAEQGIITVASDKVIQFMAENSIRRCGEIDSLTTRRLARLLECDAVITGTILEKATDHLPEIALSLILADGVSGEQIWGTMIADHRNNDQPLLGIGQRTSYRDVQQHCLDVVAAKLRVHLDLLPTLPALPATLPDYRISELRLEPELVRDGGALSCRIKIEFLDQIPETLTLETSAGSCQLHRTAIDHCYEGTIQTDPREGNHPLHLALHWADRQHERIPALASYRVANSPPKITLHVASGVDLGGSHAFSESVILIPQLDDMRPLEAGNW